MNKEDNVVLLVVFWDDSIGPELIDYTPKELEFPYSLNELGGQLYQAAGSVYGNGYFETSESILLNIKNINRSGYVFFDAYLDETVRGGERDYMLAVIAPRINYFESLQLKKILIDLSYKIRNKREYNITNYWTLLKDVLIKS